MVKIHRLIRLGLGVPALVWGLVACEDLGGAMSPKTLAEMQARTRTVAAVSAELRSRGMAPDARPASADVVRVPFTMVGGLPHVKATFGQSGPPLSMLFDTGASLNVLGATDALKRGAYFFGDDEGGDATGVGVFGEESFRAGMVPEFEVGAWSVGPIPLLVPSKPSGQGLRIMGFNAPRRFCSYVTVNYLSREIVFGFRHSYQPSGYPRVRQSPITITGGVPSARLSAGKVSWDAILDTGSFNGIEISHSVAKAMGREKEGVIVTGLKLGGVGGVKTSEEVGLRYLEIPSLSLGGMVHSHAQVDISPGIPRVGSFFFQDYKVTFDIRQKKLWLEW